MAEYSLLPLIKVGGVFALVLILLRLRLQVGLALGIGSVVLGFLFSMGPGEVLLGLVASLAEPKTILLALVVTLILILSSSMEELGLMSTLLREFRNRVGRSRWGLVTLPAIIGLLPMPGGAVFSAPMLDGFDEENRLDGSLKSFLNYWYRHVWEYWWPLYPSVLLTCSVSGIDLWRFVILSLPLSLLAIAAGLPGLLQVPSRMPSGASGHVGGPEGSLRALIPILVAIIPGVGIGIVLQWAGGQGWWTRLPREAGLIVGLVAAVIWTWWDGGMDAGRARVVLMDPKLLRMWMTVAGVFVFKGFLERSGAARSVGGLLLHLDIPVVGVAVVLPMLLGAISGLAIAYVGTAFPILVTLLAAAGAVSLKLPLMILAFASGFVGVLMSPLHLCLILSNEYFRATWSGVYRHLWPSGIMLMAGAFAYFLLLKGVWG